MIYKKYYTNRLSQRLPEGQSGRFCLTRKVVPKGTIARTYSPVGMFYFDKFGSDFPTMVLKEKSDTMEEPDNIWMSDSPMEQECMRIASVSARGDVLIVGLGIGLLLYMMRARNKMINSITIIEREQDVVNLVYRHIRSRKTKLIVGDAKDYLCTTDDKYDFIFIDIWGTFITTLREGELWATMANRCLREKGIVRWWLQELHDRIKEKLPKEPVTSSGFPAIYPPCLVCGKKLRMDYAGLCMDCADNLGVSEMFVVSQGEKDGRVDVVS